MAGEVSGIAGAPFALENTAGTDIGSACPSPASPVTPPSVQRWPPPGGLASIGTTRQFDGPPYFMGTRVYVPNGPTNRSTATTTPPR